LSVVEARRPASYEIFDIHNITRCSEPLDRVNGIRGRVDAWHAAVTT
jgi:type III restriction enzyme